MQKSDKNTNKIPTFSYFKGGKIPTFLPPTTFNPVCPKTET